MKTPEEEISYAAICERQPIPTSYFRTYEEAVSHAKFDQPAYRPYYIVERVEHFEICGVVGDKAESDLDTDRRNAPYEKGGEQMAGDMMEFPKTFDEFVDSYGFIDTEEVYTNGSQLIPVFRIKQWFEHIKALSENKGDLISRAYIEPIVEELENICINGDEHILSLLSNIKNAPPVTPQEPDDPRWD